MKKAPQLAGRIRTADLRQKIERLLELQADHLAAIRGSGDAFYSDGRHDELVDLADAIYPQLGIKPWDDADQFLSAAIAAD